jgi:hypothetical protein
MELMCDLLHVNKSHISSILDIEKKHPIINNLLSV